MEAKEIIKNALKENKDDGSQYLLNILKNEVNYQKDRFIVGKPLNHYNVIFGNGFVKVHISVDARTFKLISTRIYNIFIEEEYFVQNGVLDMRKLFEYLD